MKESVKNNNWIFPFFMGMILVMYIYNKTKSVDQIVVAIFFLINFLYSLLYYPFALRRLVEEKQIKWQILKLPILVLIICNIIVLLIRADLFLLCLSVNVFFFFFYLLLHRIRK